MAAFLAGWLAGCGSGDAPRHPDWVLHSRLQFYSGSLQSVREPLPRNAFRLSFPFIAGDLYGSATTGDFFQPVIRADYSFDIDLNAVQKDLLRSLEPTQFGLDYLKIEPAQARIARLAPLALQSDGIEQVATTDWIDASTREPVMLVYVDRPSLITGSLTRNGYSIRYHVRAAQAGYIWIGKRRADDGAQLYSAVAKPEALALALTVPGEGPTDPRKVASPARTGIPVR